MPKHYLPPFLQFVCALLLLCSAGCLTMADLQWSNPRAEVVHICDKPLDVPHNVNLWAWNSATGQLVTGDDPAELRFFAHRADVFFEYDPDAPRSSASRMPPEYGLTCAKPVRFLADPAEFFRGIEPPEVTVAEESVGRGDPRFFAAPAQGKKPGKRKDPPRVHVCVRPSWVKADVDEWAMVGDVKENRLTGNAREFAEAAANADAVFVYDATAPPESVYWFVTDPKKLSCPNKPRMTYDQAVRSQTLKMMAHATSTMAPTTAAPKIGNGQTASTNNGQTTSTSTNAANPKKGDGQTTSTSSADGNGRPLNFLEVLARNLAIAGALASGDTSGSLKDPNGSRYGIPSGKNAGGPDLLLLQAAAGTFAIIGIPFKSGKAFIERLITARSEKKVAVILDPKVLSKEIAEELAKEPTKAQLDKALKGEIVESYGMAMAMSLRDAGTILPYSRAQIFTAGWEAKYQAHHIYEVKWMEIFDKQAIADAPAVILSKTEHEVITNNLRRAKNALMDTVKKRGKEEMPHKAEVWAMYQEVYKDYPNWLKAIEGYFKK
ncbi:MAG: hypothetical protein IPM54_12390 [Polyangiaceae bacterium]|nr:hypothetical protein [Polyangiaceae bacterium]